MKLEQPFDLNPFVSTVSLPYPDSIPTGDAMLTGWGSIGRTRAPENPETLQAAMLPIIDYDLCEATLDKSVKRKGKNPLHPTNVCTGPLDGSLSACKVLYFSPFRQDQTFSFFLPSASLLALTFNSCLVYPISYVAIKISNLRSP